MDRRHLENPLSPCTLKVGYLDNDRQHLYQINQSHQSDENRHLHHKCAGRHKASQSQRAGISHKHLGRIHIKQKKAEKTSHHSPGNGTDARVLADGHNRKEGRHQNRHTGAEAVKAVCEIYSIVRTQHDKKQSRYKQNRRKFQEKAVVKAAGERNQHGGTHLPAADQVIGENACNHKLSDELLLRV